MARERGMATGVYVETALRERIKGVTDLRLKLRFYSVWILFVTP